MHTHTRSSSIFSVNATKDDTDTNARVVFPSLCVQFAGDPNFLDYFHVNLSLKYLAILMMIVTAREIT